MDYKNTLPSESQKAFTKLAQNGINKLHIGLKLFLDGSTTLDLSSNYASTNHRKMLIFSYPLHSLSKVKREQISVEEINDWIYNVLHI